MSTKSTSTLTPPPEKKFRYQQGQIQSTEHLYLATKYADIYFSFVSNDDTVTRIPAHKILLAADSDVFEAMFYGKLKENDVVVITDVSEPAFKEFLQFFYLSEVKLTAEHVAIVLYLGHKYNVKKCIVGCAKILEENLTIENVCITLSLAIVYGQTNLMKTCENWILLNTEDVFASAGFLSSEKDVLAHILRMKLLSSSEVKVFEACMAWVRAKGNQNSVSKTMIKTHLGDLFFEIRFASMTIPEICALESKYKSVLSKDFNKIVRIISQSKLKSKKFNIAPRQIEWQEDETMKCDRQVESSELLRLILPVEIDRTQFSSNKPLLLGSFECAKIGIRNDENLNAQLYLPADVSISELDRLNDGNAKICWNSKIQLQTANLR